MAEQPSGPGGHERHVPLARREGLALAYGWGYGAPWNAGACCGSSTLDRVADVAHLSQLVSDAASQPTAPGCTSAGSPTGEMMALRTAVELPDVFAAAFDKANGCFTTFTATRANSLLARRDAPCPANRQVRIYLSSPMGHRWTWDAPTFGMDATRVAWSYIAAHYR